MKQAVLFVGHGTRVQAGMAEFEHFVASAKREILQKIIQTDLAGRETSEALWFGSCFLELRTPTILEMIETAISVGCCRILVVPVFLFAARHIKIDIPQQLDSARARHENVEIDCLPPFGVDSAIVHVTTYRLIESGWNPGLRNACVVFVCRGGGDKHARQQFLDVVKRSMNEFKSHYSIVKVAYLAGEGPRLESVLTKCLQEHHRSVYVVPILLFHGQLTKDLGKQIERWRGMTLWNGMQVVSVSHLQPHDALVKRISDKAVTAIHALSTV